MKLEKALREFDLNVEGKLLLDIGASTGGFTDCALHTGQKLLCDGCRFQSVGLEIEQDERVICHGKDEFPLFQA